jgi:tRNA(fMet)-specific endonuclease VapC
MSYLIDSDWLIDHLENVPTATQLLQSLAPQGIAISIVTYMEVMQGILRNPDPRAAQARFESFLANVPVLPFSPPVAERCAGLRETLKQQNRRVNSRALDLINAAIALEYGLTLVTRNVGDYQDISGLIIYP